MAALGGAVPPAYQRSLHAPHLCGPYKRPTAAPPPPWPYSATAKEVLEKQEEEPPLRVYCDLDGVLADFNRGCLALFPEGGPIARKIPTHTVTKLTYEEESEMWRRVEEKGEFFLSLPWMLDGQELWGWLDREISGPPPSVLTGLPVGRAGQMASRQKEQWCRERLGERATVFCCGTRNKQKFSGRNCILIDDRGDLREAWEARGGIFIHHVSASESVRQMSEVLQNYRRRQRRGLQVGLPGGGEAAGCGGCGGGGPARPPRQRAKLNLTAVCWAAQTPAGCFRHNCRYLHVPISRRHRSWIQLWGFVWWNKRMFHDLDSLVECARAVYSSSPTDKEAFGPLGDEENMDEQSRSAYQRMHETLQESVGLGLPLDFLQRKKTPGNGSTVGFDGATSSPLPPLPQQVREVLHALRAATQGCAELGGAACHVVVAGSMGLGVDVDGSDLDLVLCCPLELEPLAALRALRDLLASMEAVSGVLLVEQAATPVVSFRFDELEVDVAVNAMGSIRDALLFRYALGRAAPELVSMLRLVKVWLKRRHIPATRQGGFPTLVWMRLGIRFYQEQSGSAGGQRTALDWMRRLFFWASKALPTTGSPLAVDGEQAEAGIDKYVSGVSPGTLLLLLREMRDFLEIPPLALHTAGIPESGEGGGHGHLCRVGHWEPLGGARQHGRPRPQAIFCVPQEGGAWPPHLMLCAVHGVFAGPRAELRCCACRACSACAAGSEDGNGAVQYVSRRSSEWLVVAYAERPAQTRTQKALENAGILKKRAPPREGLEGPAEPPPGTPMLLFQPCHLFTRLSPAEEKDPEACLARAQHLLASAPWLPAPEPFGPRLRRGLLLSRRSRLRLASEDQISGGGEASRCWRILPRQTVYELEPHRRALEEARARDEADARLRAAGTMRSLRRAMREELEFGGGTEAMQEAAERLQALAVAMDAGVEPHNGAARCGEEEEPSSSDDDGGGGSFAASSGASPPPPRLGFGGGDDGAGRARRPPPPEASDGPAAAAPGLGGDGATAAGGELSPPSPEEGLHDLPGAGCGEVVVLAHLHRRPGEICGFSCEAGGIDVLAAAAAAPGSGGTGSADGGAGGCQWLKIVSISEHGLLGQYNVKTAPSERVSEGSRIIAVNGVRGDAARMRAELEQCDLVLHVLLDRAEQLDRFGRRRLTQPELPEEEEEQLHAPRCRCGGRCKCGLADALGRCKAGLGPSWAPQAALRIGNLCLHVDEEELYRLFSPVAPVATVRVVYDTKTWRSEGHGYVHFHSFPDAQRVLDTLDGTRIRGRPCFLTWSTKAKRAAASVAGPGPPWHHRQPQEAAGPDLHPQRAGGWRGGEWAPDPASASTRRRQRQQIHPWAWGNAGHSWPRGTMMVEQRGPERTAGGPAPQKPAVRFQ